MSLFTQLEQENNWELQYAILIDAGKHLPEFPEELRTPSHRVEGCNVPTWCTLEPSDNDHLALRGYSKSHIVQGLIALLQEYCHSHTVSELRTLSTEDFYPLRIHELITPTRQNGFAHMIALIRDKASDV